MKKYYLCTIDDFLSDIRNLSIFCKKIFLTLLCWNDGDYFIDICNENGGISIEQQEILKNIPLGRKYTSIKDLELFIRKLNAIGYFHSINNEYKLFFDIHIWIGGYYYIFNPFLEEIYLEKLNYIKRFLHPVIVPKWQLQIKDYNKNNFSEYFE